MCNTFTCPCCNNTFFDRCAEADFESKSHCDNTKSLELNKRCDACKAVIGAIEKLESLVYQAPFLETAGMSGLDDIQGWERDEYKAILTSSCGSKSWESKAESRAERHALVEKMQNMGLSDIQDARKEHQGFDMVKTPQMRFEAGTDSDKENVKPGVSITC